MSDREREILNTIEKVLPKMTELEQEKLLSFSEGVAFMKSEQERQEAERTESVTA